MTPERTVPPLTVFIVEDHEDFRQYVVSVLQQRTYIQIVGQTGDGSEAVQRIQQLRPDLVLLDIGLPSLNGLEVAQRIRVLSPQSKILFISQESSLEIVREALRTGAQGYLLKSDAAAELLRAIVEIVNGNAFVSRTLALAVSGDAATENSRNLSPPRLSAAPARVHRVSFFPNDAALVEGFVEFVEDAINNNTPIVVAATASHRNGILQVLQARGWDLGAARREGTFVLLDARAMVASILRNNWPDGDRFMNVVNGVIRDATKAATRKSSKVAVCGECAHILWAQGKTGAAIQLEQLWDEIAKTTSVDILCGYLLSYFHRGTDVRFFERICSEHSDAACV